MKPASESAATAAPAHSNFVIKVLGVGGAGGNAVNHLAREPRPGVQFALLNTDSAALAESAVAAKLVLGSKSTRGLGAGGDPEQGRQAAEEELDQIQRLCQGANIVFVVAGLGGGTGTGAGPVVARVAKECGALVLAIVMTPFDCEGARRQRQAQAGLETLKQAADGVICLPNQKVFTLIDDHTSLVEAFAIINNFVAQGVRGIWRLLSRPGLINVDFADLCAVTQGKHSESALITVEAKGEHRVREISEKLMAHPLIEGGQTLARATGILVCIAGGPELSMKDVERIMDQVRRHSDQAHVIMGTAVDPQLAERLAVTLVASCAQSQPPASPAPQSTPPAATVEPPPSGPLQDECTGGEDEEDPVEADALEEKLGRANPFSARAKGEKRATRIVAPPPELSQQQAQELFLERTGRAAAKKKAAHRLRQGQLPLEIISKGRFERSEPTLHRGEDLDVPTYIRRGVPLN